MAQQEARRRRRKRRRIPEGVYETRIDGLSDDFRGIARIDGKVHFIFGALPDELVTFRYLKVNSKFCECNAIEVIDSPSPMRVRPLCEYFGSCGGCSLQHISSDCQLNLKKDALLGLLKRFGGIDGPSCPMERPSHREALGYRRSSRLGVKFVPKKGGVIIGFRERYSHFIQEMDRCLILPQMASQLIVPLKRLFNSLSIRDKIPQLEIYCADNGVYIIIRHLEPFSQRDISLLKAFSSTNDVFFFLQPKGPDTIAPLMPHWPEAYYTVELGEYGQPDWVTCSGSHNKLRLYFYPSDFIQVNAPINIEMIRAAIGLLMPQKDDAIIDLFSGIGNFSLPLSIYAQKVTGIELSEKMAERARRNVIINGLGHKDINFYALDLYSSLDSLPSILKGATKVVIDPPRSGAKEICELLKGSDVKKILYISCNPATFSRDANILCNKGHYILKHLKLFDMFPHTSHSEVMGLFELAK